MKKYFLFGLAIALTMGFGCAVTNYSLITDNDAGGGAINTAGKAFINQSSQIAFIYPDGDDNLIWHVDQKTNGDRTLYTGNFFTTASSASPFIDTLYCDPDWTGCQLVVADDPENGDTDIFDFNLNAQCGGARTLSLLTSTGRYYGECGRAKADRMQNVLNIANHMTPVVQNGQTWLKGVLNSSNLTYIIDNNNGATASFGPASDLTVLVDGVHRHAIADMSNPVIGQNLSRILSWVNAHPGPSQTVTGVLNGQSKSGNIKILPDQMDRFIKAHF